MDEQLVHMELKERIALFLKTDVRKIFAVARRSKHFNPYLMVVFRSNRKSIKLIEKNNTFIII